ncbi:hypothetical protein [Thermococcus sp.]
MILKSPSAFISPSLIKINLLANLRARLTSCITTMDVPPLLANLSAILITSS